MWEHCEPRQEQGEGRVEVRYWRQDLVPPKLERSVRNSFAARVRRVLEKKVHPLRRASIDWESGDRLDL